MHRSSPKPAASGGSIASCGSGVRRQAIELAKVPAGAALRCKGFLARRYRTGITVALHVNEFDLITQLEGN